MKTNILKLSILVLTIGLSMSSCNDSFLDRAPIVNISDGNFWNTTNDLQLYVNNFYNNSSLLPTYTGWSTVGPCGLDADYGSDTQITPNYSTTLNGERTIPASGGGWSVSDWSLLRRINYFLDNYHRVNANWNDVKQYVGEVYVFRSIFYFAKLRSFGDLPWASHTLTDDSEILYQARLPRNVVVDSIMDDLDKAVEYLPARGNYTGRLTKEVAMLLQARIALFEGTWEKYHALKNTPFKVEGQDGSKFIKKAADVSTALMDLAQSSGKTGLVDGKGMAYSDLFSQIAISLSRLSMAPRQTLVLPDINNIKDLYTATPKP